MKKKHQSTEILAAPAATQTVNEPMAPLSAFTDNNLRKFFFGSLIAMLLLTWFTGFDGMYHQDEMDMAYYGKAVINFYTSGGKDTTYKGTNRWLHDFDPLLQYYGCGFEYFAQTACMLTGTKDSKYEFAVRHVVVQFFGILAIMFTGFVARKFAGWRGAILAAWLAFLSPSFSGHILFNTKDIPFCLGYIASLYYIICLLEQLPNVTWKTTLKLMLAIAFTVDVRIGGVILLFYLALFTVLCLATKPKIFKVATEKFTGISLKYLIIVAGSITIVVVGWPFLVIDPLNHFIDAMNVIQKYPAKINVNFAGETINSAAIPPIYIPKMLSITIPILVLVSGFIGIAYVSFRYRAYNIRAAALLLFATLFPVIYAIQKSANMYCGWRHFLFIYPSICIFAAIGVLAVFFYSRNRIYQISIGAVVAISLINPIAWSIRNHPYEYCYFNELSGGYKNIYYNYDSDYWQMTLKKSLDWLVLHEHLEDSKDTIILGSNTYKAIEHYMAVRYPRAKVKVVKVGCTLRNYATWRYAVFNSFLLKPDYLENYFPPKTMIQSTDIEGMPVTVVLKDTARLDLKAFDALKNANNALADSLYSAYEATTKDGNAALDGYFSLTKALTGKNDEAIAAAYRALKYQFTTELDYNAQCALGIAFSNKGQFEESIAALNVAIATLPDQVYARNLLAQVENLAKGKPIGANPGK